MFFCVLSYRIIQITSRGTFILLYYTIDPFTLQMFVFMSESQFLLFPGVSEHDVSVLRVQLNESISLNCSMTDRYEISWYHQSPESGRLTLLMSAKTSSVAGRKLLVRYKNWSRLTVKADEGINTVTLVISGLTGSDSGLYFCGTRSVEMLFDKPIRLVMEG